MGFFLSHDKKFLFKSVKVAEFEMFVDFGPWYFDYMTKSFFHNYPNNLAKIVGAYAIKVKSEEKPELNNRLYLLVSENLNLGITPEDEPDIVRFDLKGSENNRLVTPTVGPNGVPEKVTLLDNNFLF